LANDVCIIGGGMAGVGLWWCLSQPGQPGRQWNVTLIHDGPSLGGHALTLSVNYKDQQIPVDTGVQFYVPMLYLNIDAILKRPEFASVRTVQFNALTVGSAFPPAAGTPQNWGNFPAYGATNSTKPIGSQFALYSPTMWADATTFQNAVDAAVVNKTLLSQTLDEYFAQSGADYQDLNCFQNMFLAPYLSIINGYGATLSNQVTFEDLLPLFGSLGSGSPWPGLARFTEPCQGYQRFVDGATSFISAMATAAGSNNSNYLLRLNSSVQAVYPDPGNSQSVIVKWIDGSGNPMQQSFDKVVITTDMQSASCMLAAGPGDAWSTVYAPYVCPIANQLLPGYCIVHTDASVLSPDLLNGQETLQFTAYYAADPSQQSGYNLFLTYTTYLQGNIHEEFDASGLYLTMYGYLPEGVPPPQGCLDNPCNLSPITPQPTKLPEASSILFQEFWLHGMWLPQFMLAEKQMLHLAQGPGKYQFQGQSPYPIYFAGNNTTADSLEHAFLSGAIIADYAFDSPLPVGSNLPAFAMYYLFYTEFMFPGCSPTARRLQVLHDAMRQPS
jgi:hypothetical protein